MEIRYIFGNKHSFVTAHMVPGAGAGDGISGGFHFPIYTFRFSLNQKWLARADLVIRGKSSKQGFYLKTEPKQTHPYTPTSPHPKKNLRKVEVGGGDVCVVGTGRQNQGLWRSPGGSAQAFLRGPGPRPAPSALAVPRDPPASSIWHLHVGFSLPGRWENPQPARLALPTLTAHFQLPPVWA